MKNIIKLIPFFLLIVLVGCSSGGGLLDRSVTMDQSASIVGSRGITYEFSAVEPIDEEIRVVQKDNQIANQLKAFAGGVLALYPDDYDTYKEIEESGRCPAPFLNSSAFMYLIGTDKVSVANTIKNCKEGDTLEIKGYIVDMDMSKDGRDLPPMNKSSRIEYIYVDSISKK